MNRSLFLTSVAVFATFSLASTAARTAQAEGIGAHLKKAANETSQAAQGAANAAGDAAHGAADSAHGAAKKAAGDAKTAAQDAAAKHTDSATPAAKAAKKKVPLENIEGKAKAKLPKARTLKGGLKVEDVVVGTGKEAKKGDKVVVDYTGTLPNGKQFDTSIGRGPFEFTLGAGEVIKGWDEGVAGMRVGGKRKLTIPATLGYGDRDMGVIPPNSTLLFDVELKDVK